MASMGRVAILGSPFWNRVGTVRTISRNFHSSGFGRKEEQFSSNSRPLQTSSSRHLHTSSSRLAPDPYNVLGLSRDASLSDIKLKYRELAKKHHPDLNPGPDAAAKMSAISSAYQLLSDPKQKQFFDQTGMSAEDAGVNPDQAAGNPFKGGFGGVDPSFMFTDFTSFFNDAFSGSRPGGHVHKGDDIETEVTLDFLEAAKGCRKVVHLNTNSSCGDCNGSGCAPGTSMTTCRPCGGTGTQKIERGPIVFGTVCGRCNGSGQVVSQPCKSCKGAGVRSQPRAVDLDFPAGVRSGMELRISQQGHAGLRGGRTGDLFVKVNVRPHAQFKLVHDDLHVTVLLTLKQCLMGGEVQVPTLDGELKLTVPEGTAPGDVKILRGKGVKKLQERGYGDISVQWGLNMPKSLTDRQKELIREFDNIQFNRSSETKQSSKSSVPPPPRPPASNRQSSESKPESTHANQPHAHASKSHAHATTKQSPQASAQSTRRDGQPNKSEKHEKPILERSRTEKSTFSKSSHEGVEKTTDSKSEGTVKSPEVGRGETMNKKEENTNKNKPSFEFGSTSSKPKKTGFSPSSWFGKKFAKMDGDV